MGAKTFWSREQADAYVHSFHEALGGNVMYNNSADVAEVHVCGDLRRDPDAEQVTTLSFVAVVQEGVNVPNVRHKCKSNVQAIFPGAYIRNFKKYDYIILPDDSGTISWLVVEKENLGAALIHATGPVSFIQMLELFAESVGAEFGASGVKREGAKIPALTEASLFKHLGAKFVKPEDRAEIRYIVPEKS